MQLLDVVATARVLGISERMLRTLAAKNAIAVVKIGRRRLFSPAALEEFVRRHEAKPEQRASA
jgi:excisionase family DNA binding protein